MQAYGNLFAASPFLPSPLLSVFYHTGPSVTWTGTCHRGSELAVPSVRNHLVVPRHYQSFHSSTTSLGRPCLTPPPPDSASLDLNIPICFFSLIFHWHFTSLSEITLFIFTCLFSLLVFVPSPCPPFQPLSPNVSCTRTGILSVFMADSLDSWTLPGIYEAQRKHLLDAAEEEKFTSYLALNKSSWSHYHLSFPSSSSSSYFQKE